MADITFLWSFTMKRQILLTALLVAFLVLACEEKLEAQNQYYEGLVVTVYRVPERRIPGEFYVIDTDGNLQTTNDRKRAFLPDEQKNTMQSVEVGDTLRIMWGREAESLGFAMLPFDLDKLTKKPSQTAVFAPDPPPPPLPPPLPVTP